MTCCLSRRAFLQKMGVTASAPIWKQWRVKPAKLPQDLRCGKNPRKAVTAQADSDHPVIGYAVYGNDNLDTIDQIAHIRDLGFQAVAFHSTPTLAPLRAVDPYRLSQQDTKRLCAALSGFKKIEVHGPFSNWDICLVSPNPLIRRGSLDELQRHMDFAARIGATLFNIHPGKTQAQISVDQRIGLLVDSLCELAQMGEERQILVTVEIADDLVDSRNVVAFEAVKSDFLGITLDTGHISSPIDGRPGYAPYGSIQGFIRAWAKLIKHVHFNDHNGERDHVGIGQGNLPLRDILATLHSVNYRGFLTLEIDPAVVPVKDITRERDLVQSWINDIWG